MAQDVQFLDKRVAILGGSTTNDIKLVMELFLLDQGIRPVFYESEYNQYYQDAVFPNPELEAFKLDVVYIHTTNRNVTRYPSLEDDAAAVDGMIRDEMAKFMSIWESLAQKYHCPIIQNT